MVYRGRVSNNWVTCMGLEYGRRGDWLGTWTRRPDLLWQKMDLLSPQPTHVGQGVCFHFAPFREIQRRRLNQMCSVFVQGSVCRIFLTFVKKVAATVTSEKHSGFL
jgi:hypothetical protein